MPLGFLDYPEAAELPMPGNPFKDPPVHLPTGGNSAADGQVWHFTSAIVNGVPCTEVRVTCDGDRVLCVSYRPCLPGSGLVMQDGAVLADVKMRVEEQAPAAFPGMLPSSKFMGEKLVYIDFKFQSHQMVPVGQWSMAAASDAQAAQDLTGVQIDAAVAAALKNQASMGWSGPPVAFVPGQVVERPPGRLRGLFADPPPPSKYRLPQCQRRPFVPIEPAADTQVPGPPADPAPEEEEHP